MSHADQHAAADTLPHSPTSHGPLAMTTFAVPTGNIACEGCVAIIERRLRASPHVLSVDVDSERRVAHVQTHEGTVSVEELAELVAGACGDRNPVPLPKPQVSSHAHAHTARPEEGGIDHAARPRDEPAHGAH